MTLTLSIELQRKLITELEFQKLVAHLKLYSRVESGYYFLANVFLLGTFVNFANLGVKNLSLLHPDSSSHLLHSYFSLAYFYLHSDVLVPMTFDQIFGHIYNHFENHPLITVVQNVQ